MSLFYDWAESVAALPTIKDINTLPDEEVVVTWKIVAIRGEIVPGFITFDVGFLDPEGNWILGITKSVSLIIPEDLVDEVADLLSFNPADESVVALMDYVQQHPAFIGNITEYYRKPQVD